MSTRRASPRKSSARRSRAVGATTSCSQARLPGLGDRRGPVDGARTQPRALRLRTADLFDPHPRDRGRRAADLRPHGMGVISYSPLAGGWLSGRYRKGSDQQGPASPARQKLASRFDLSLPENQRKLEPTEQLGDLAEEAGMTLIEMAIAFVVRHPAVTEAIIGPRTMDHLESQLT